MKRAKNPSSILQVARLYRPHSDAVKSEVLRLLRAAPPFSYEDLYLLVWDYVQGLVGENHVKTAIDRIGQKVKRESYRRAFSPIARYFAELPRNFTTPIEPRTYSLARAMRVQCAPPMMCGNDSGLIIPWPLFWQRNPLTEEQFALFATMALDVIDRDGELEGAELIMIDTSSAALDKSGRPTQIRARDLPRLSSNALGRMIEVFLRGYALAVEEWVASERKTDNVREVDTQEQMILL